MSKNFALSSAAVGVLLFGYNQLKSTSVDSNITDKYETQANVKPYPWTIHVTPHSHDDVGWLKTMDAYFDGSDQNTQYTNVNVELTTVINSLKANPDRKFSEVEMAFFKKWYDLQTDSKK